MPLKQIVFLFAVGFFYLGLSYAEIVDTSGPNVIYITIDGVRYEDFFSNRPDPRLSKNDSAQLMPYFWSELAPKGVLFGDVRLNQRMEISNTTGISYPAYLSMFNGLFTKTCESNDYVSSCPRNTVETFPERLVNEKSIAKRSVAVFSSWKRIEDAVESVQGKITVNAGAVEFVDPFFPDAHSEVNQNQRDRLGSNPSDISERPDDITFKHGLIYLKNHQPRFMYLYFTDSDTHAHQGRYDLVVKDLRTYDKWLKIIIDMLGKMGTYGEQTSIVLTTDHGRGIGAEWIHHGRGLQAASFENSKRVWGFVYGPNTPALGSVIHPLYGHINLRPTMEKLLGLELLPFEAPPMKECLLF